MKKSLLGKWKEINEKKLAKSVTHTEEYFPLTHNQSSLYFLSQLYPENPFYNYGDLYQFNGKLDVNRIVRAFEIICLAHSVFRTKFRLQDGVPVQVVSDKPNVDIIKHDKEIINSDQALEIIKIDTNMPFDFSKAEFMRVSVIKLRGDQHYVALISHHILIDKWSMGLIRSQLAQVYSALNERSDYSLAEPGLSFGEFAALMAEKTISAEKINFWKNKLIDAQEVLNLPLDFTRPKLPTFRGRHYTREFTPEISLKAENFCIDNNITPFVFFLSCYFILLRKYTGQKIIPVGVPFSARDSSELENVIGFFDDTVVLVSELEDISFSDFIEKVKLTSLEAFDNKDVPLDTIIKELNPERLSGINPLFQTMFIYHKEPASVDFGDNLSFSANTMDNGVSKFDLTLFIGQNSDGFYASIEYATDLFTETTIDDILSNYFTLVNNCLEDPSTGIDHLSVLTNEKYEKIVYDWNLTEVELEEQTVLELIQSQIVNQPDAIALADSQERIRYSDLDRLSNRVASYLNDSGIGNGDVVGLCFGRSAQMIVNMIGVLKAGAAYIPIDPSYPFERIKFMILNSDCQLLVKADDVELGDLNVINSINYSEIQDRKEMPMNVVKHKSADTAYIIYTSGSTGKPKGVPINHRNLYSSTMARNELYKENVSSFLLLSSFSFDSSVAGIYWTLCTGGKLVIAENRIEQDLEKMGEVLQNESITHMLLLPTLYQQILNFIDLSTLGILRTVILAGESITATVVNDHFKKTQDCALFNEYGPTEATVWATAYEFSDKSNKILIGRPISNTKIYLLDNIGKPVPIGAVGEIYIGGLNISSGYLGVENNSEDKFIESGFVMGDRLYRTGDLGRYDHQGNITFLGRKDQQVKIRGYRIELSEIEENLNSFVGIKEGIVLVQVRSEVPSHDSLLKSMSDVEMEKILDYVESLDDETLRSLLK